MRSPKDQAAILVAILFMISIAGCGVKKDLATGSVWEITQTTNLDKLTIAEGSGIKAPEGYSVSLTVDGVETPIEPGSYKGNIVLTLTKEIPVQSQNRT
jgi:uncharacterized lipoprotein YehR (DUF1307 family)